MNAQIPMNVPLLGQQQAVQFGCAENDGNLATPIVIPALLTGPNGAKMIVSFGGLTKLEHGALQVAASIAGAQRQDMCETPSDIAKCAADLAEQVLAECAKRQPELHTK